MCSASFVTNGYGDNQPRERAAILCPVYVLGKSLVTKLPQSYKDWMTFLNAVGLSKKRQSELESDVQKLTSVGEFASDLFESIGKSDLVKSIGKAAPWLAPVGAAASESFLLVKVIAKIIEKIPKGSPEKLGLLACTVAFQSSLRRALVEVGPPAVPIPLTHSFEDSKEKLAGMRTADPELLRYFSLKNPTANPFVWQAMEAVRMVLWVSGYDEAELRHLEGKIYQGFSSCLFEILSAHETKEKFDPFLKRAELGSEEDRAYALINAYVEKQRAEFTQIPRSGVLPVALSQVYVDTDCGRLMWQDIRGDGRAKFENRLDAFSEENGGRHTLLGTVIDYLGDENFKEPVIIQGSAGAGKSTFTLRLGVELLREGLIPIRIRVARLRTDLPLLKSIHEVIVNTPDLFAPGQFSKPTDVLLGGSIFDDATRFRNAQISRYVLILDGWDEISAADKSYQAEVSRFLANTRTELLYRSNPPVRVVLTGRPSEALANASFLGDDTPVLTMRPYTSEQLQDYLQRLRGFAEQQPRLSGRAFDSIVKRLIKRYREEGSRRFEVLSQPLLALLTFQVATECEKEEQIAALLENPTNLYRRLLDLTCSRAGKADQDADSDSARQVRIRGQELRSILRRTAAAITTFGEECISFDELKPRARLSISERAKFTEGPSQDRPWTPLIVSFFFKAGGEHHGLEFLHKSFREYLYAEEIVECIKFHGAKQRGSVPVRPTDLGWQDFPIGGDHDQRYDFSRSLCELVSAQNLSDEVREHIATLLEWEIERSGVKAAKPEPLATDPIAASGWPQARDLLTEIWDWWLSRTPFRLQPSVSAMTGWTEMKAPFVDHLIELAAQRDRQPHAKMLPPLSGLGVDGDLGLALLFLTIQVYSKLQKQQGWKGDWETIEDTDRPFQTEVGSSAGKVRVFKPNGPRVDDDFRVALSRFQTAAWGSYPTTRILLSGLDLRKANLQCFPFILADFSNSNLSDARFGGCVLEAAIFKNASLQNVDFFTAYLADIDLSGADIRGAEFDKAFGLTAEILALAKGDAETTLPEGIERPAHWDA
jgi:hypothetical protein